MNELLREIEEDIRRERIDKLWGRFGKLMVGMSIAIVLATVVIVIMQNARRTREEQQTAVFMRGMDRLGVADDKGAIAAFTQLTNDDSSSYYGMAMLRKAQAQKDSGDKDGAAKTYAALSAHDDAFGELAKMLTNPDAPLNPQKSSPFYESQSEWQGWQLVKQGKKDEAAKIFMALRDDENAPPSLRERMDVVLQHIAPEKLSEKLNEELTNAKAPAHE